MGTNRLIWPDFCKFVAMFLVTWGHASQVISGEIFNNFMGGGILVAVHMPLFFIISGYFIDIDKLRATKIVSNFENKFLRLMLPAICWTALYCLATSTFKGPLSFLTFYWYIFSLFSAFIILSVISKILKNNLLVILISTVVIILMPYSDIANLNFMFPFLLIGYMLRTFPIKYSLLWFILSCLITVGLLFIWDWDYTVYLCRFNTANLSAVVIYKSIVRLILGTSFSFIFIWLSKQFEGSGFVSKYSEYGKYTLVTYLFSIFIFGILRKYITIQIDTPLLLEFLSFMLCIATYALSILLCKELSKVKYIRTFLLGIV